MIRIKLDVDIEVERERISPMISQVLSDVLDGTVTNRKLFTSEKENRVHFLLFG